MAHKYHGILFSLNTKGNSDTCYNMCDPRSEISQTQKGKYCMMPLNRSYLEQSVIETEGRVSGSCGWEGRKTEGHYFISKEF